MVVAGACKIRVDVMDMEQYRQLAGEVGLSQAELKVSPGNAYGSFQAYRRAVVSTLIQLEELGAWLHTVPDVQDLREAYDEGESVDGCVNRFTDE